MACNIFGNSRIIQHTYIDKERKRERKDERGYQHTYQSTPTIAIKYTHILRETKNCFIYFYLFFLNIFLIAQHIEWLQTYSDRFK